MKISLLNPIIVLSALLINGIICDSDDTKRDHVLDDFLEGLGPAPIELSNVIPTPGLPVASVLGYQNAMGKEERDLDEIRGYQMYDYKYPKEEFSVDENDIYPDETSDNEDNRLSKRALDTLGDMQIHDGYKRGFDNLGGTHMHGGYKRFLSSLGGSQIHDYKRAFDTHGGSNLQAYKRYISSLGGGNIHDGYKRSIDGLGGVRLHDVYKRYLSSLGGGNIHNGKRSLDSLGGVNLHSGYKRRFLSSLGGTNIHDGGYKRTLSSLGGMNIHRGFKRTLSSLGGAEIFGYKRNGQLAPFENVGNANNEMEKRQFPSLGGFDVHRYKRSDENVDASDKTSQQDKKQE